MDGRADKEEFLAFTMRVSMLMGKQQWDAALDMAKAYANAHADQPKLWTVVADVAAKARDKGGVTAATYNQEAIAAATQVIALQPDNANAHIKRGRMFCLQKDLVKAEQDFHSALEHWPNHAVALYELGNIAFMHDRWVEAEKYYQEALKQRSYASAYNALGLTLMRQERHEEAVQPLLTAIKLRPRWAKYRYSLANCLDALGQTEEAQKVRERAKPRRDAPNV